MAPLRLVGGQPMTPEERRMALRVAAIIAIPLATIVVVALVGGFLVYRGQTADRLAANRDAIVAAREATSATRKLTVRLNREQAARERQIAQAVYHECVANEAQDAVLVQQLHNAIVAILEQPGRPNATALAYIEGLREGIRALEPPNEKDCVIPGGSS